MSISSANVLADSPSRAREHLVPRLVMTEQGLICYVSDGFEQLIGRSGIGLKGLPVKDIISFCEPDQALREQSFLLFRTDHNLDPWCQAIQDGIHKVQLAGRANEMFDFHFEWMQMGNRQRFLVMSMGDSEACGLDRSAARALLGDEAPPPAAPTTNIRPLFAVAERPSVNPDNSMKAFVELCDDILIQAEPDGLIRYLNPEGAAKLGCTISEDSATNFLDLISQDDRAPVRALFLSLNHSEQADDPLSFEARITGTAGAVFWMAWRIKRQGTSLYLSGRDLTRIKTDELNLLRHQERLSEAEAIAHMGYWQWKVGEKDIMWSDEIYRIFGVTRGEFLPNIDSINTVLYRRDVGRVVQAFQRAMIERNTYEMDFRIVRPGGEIRFIHCEGRCDIDFNGDVVALFGIMQDITERMRDERELREAKNAAERAYAAKSQFLANMSHELRTPLNAIIGFSEMMQRQLLGPIGCERYLEYIDGIRSSGEHLLDLISDILDMSKIEAGKYSLDLETISLAKVLRLAVHMVESRADDAKVTLHYLDLPESLYIVADRRAILQMVLNLLSNAIKFTEKGGSVKVSCDVFAEKVIIKVADTGIGIPPNLLHTITRPFEQVANHYTRSHEGSGLGLAITKELCQMHGGALDIESSVGVGTTVTITLPRDAAAQRAA